MNEERQTPMQDPELELRETLEQIRREGVPYSSSEPDALYWANFRVRLNERLEARQSIGWFDRVKSWVLESGMRSRIIGTSMVAAVLATVYFGISDTVIDPVQKHEPIATIQEPPQEAQVARADSLIDAGVNVNEANAVVPESTSQLAEAVTNEVADELLDVEAQTPTAIVDESADVGSEPVLLAANGDVPVSLSDLTEAELEAILESVEQMD